MDEPDAEEHVDMFNRFSYDNLQEGEIAKQDGLDDEQCGPLSP